MSVDHEVRNPLISIGLILDKMKNCDHCGSWYKRGKESVTRIADALDKLASVDIPATSEFEGREFIDTSKVPEPKHETNISTSNP